MALGNIEQMTQPLSEEKQVAMSDETDRIEKAAMTWFLDTYGQEGLDSYLEGGTDMGSIINEYLQFRFYEMN